MNVIKKTRTKKSVTSPYFRNNQVKTFSKTSEFNDCPKKDSNSVLCFPDKRLKFPFFDIPCIELAKALLGKILVRVLPNGIVLKGLIVETESYLGNEDKASISFGGKITEKSKPMYMKPGTTFVYLTYGMYSLINISSQGDGAAVLLRALDPIEGMEQMITNRNEFQPNKNKPKKENKDIPHHQLCNGPAKLCISLNITKDQCNKQDLSKWSEMWIEEGNTIPEEQIVKSRRIGIDSAGPEWANKLLRFYIFNNKSVSKRDKVQEAILCG
uniref:DNA-3-methyladenine glycosylase n=2 Tax=Homalodisca liturata TaxID=320908 RepID=A0A1B6K7A4_9HEMI